MNKFLYSLAFCSTIAMSAQAGKIHSDFAEKLGQPLSKIGKALEERDGEVDLKHNQSGTNWSFTAKAEGGDKDLLEALQKGRLVTTGHVDQMVAGKGYEQIVFRGVTRDGKSLLPGTVTFTGTTLGGSRPADAAGMNFWL